jgi:hypothetical protein
LVDFYFPTALDICRVEDLETSRKLPEAFWGHPRSCARQRLPAGAGMLWGAPTAKMGMHNVEGPPGKGQLVHSKSDYDEAKKMVWDMFEIFWVFGWYIYSYRGVLSRGPLCTAKLGDFGLLARLMLPHRGTCGRLRRDKTVGAVEVWRSPSFVAAFLPTPQSNSQLSQPLFFPCKTFQKPGEDFQIP